ncbi:MAG TPA: hypothetical protein VHC94_10860 [Nitrobacter sp.]|nr:hypothetical protein [Nitrobacter sp.]
MKLSDTGWIRSRNDPPSLTLTGVRHEPERIAPMRKVALAACCAALLGLGSGAVAQTSGPPSQNSMKQNDTMSKDSSMSQGSVSKAKTAKSNTTKHKTVGMTKKPAMKKDNMSK